VLRGVRVVARGHTPKPDHFAQTGSITDTEHARKGTRDAYWGDGFVATPVYDGAQLAPGASVTGPALIEEPFTVVVLPPGATATLDEQGNYVIDL
jgi:N-methylhydantoinase A/oxoprolinase/acetone carboxylase beta subunit